MRSPLHAADCAAATASGLTRVRVRNFARSRRRPQHSQRPVAKAQRETPAPPQSSSRTQRQRRVFVSQTEPFLAGEQSALLAHPGHARAAVAGQARIGAHEDVARRSEQRQRHLVGIGVAAAVCRRCDSGAASAAAHVDAALVGEEEAIRVRVTVEEPKACLGQALGGAPAGLSESLAAMQARVAAVVCVCGKDPAVGVDVAALGARRRGPPVPADPPVFVPAAPPAPPRAPLPAPPNVAPVPPLVMPELPDIPAFELPPRPAIPDVPAIPAASLVLPAAPPSPPTPPEPARAPASAPANAPDPPLPALVPPATAPDPSGPLWVKAARNPPPSPHPVATANATDDVVEATKKPEERRAPHPTVLNESSNVR